MLNRIHLLSAIVMSATAGLFAVGASAQNTVVTQERNSVTVRNPNSTISNVGMNDRMPSLPAGITAKNLNEDKSIDKSFKAVAEDALSKNHFDNLVDNLVDQDRDRIKKSVGNASLTNVDGNNNQRLNDLAVRLNDSFKSKYNHDFDMDYKKVFTQDFLHIMTGEVADPALLTGKWPVDAGIGLNNAGKLTAQDAAQARDKVFGGDVNLEKGRNVAIAHIPASHGLPAISASLIHENMGGWKFDVPNTLTAQKLHDNLVANLSYLDQHKAELPSDINEAYRHVTHAVVAALYDMDLSKGSNTASGTTLDPGSVRPSNTPVMPSNSGTVNNR
jgi:hypothetical protein